MAANQQSTQASPNRGNNLASGLIGLLVALTARFTVLDGWSTALLSGLGVPEAITDIGDARWAWGLTIVVGVITFLLARLSRVTDWLGERLDQWLLSRLDGFGYLKKYRIHLYQRHRNFDVKGLTTQSTHTLELQHVLWS